MLNSFLQSGKTVKIKIGASPSYLSFQGIIEKVERDIFIVKTDVKYIQKESQIVKCTIINNSARVCLFETTIKYVVNNKLFLITPNEENMRVVQRRKYIRVPLDKEVNCYFMEADGKKVEGDKVFSARVKNIGGGGVLLNSPLSSPLDTVLVFEMELDNDSFLLTVEVLRESESKEDGTNNLGCQFIGIDEGDRQKIIAYCNRQQLILKRKNII